MANDSFRILGRVIDQNRKPVPGLRIEAWDKEKVLKEVAGTADTDKDGNFRIELDELRVRKIFKDRRPDLFFKMYRGRALVKSTENSISRKVVIGETRVLLQVELDAAQIAAMPLEDEAPPPVAAPPTVVSAPPPVSAPSQPAGPVHVTVEMPPPPPPPKPRVPQGADVAALLPQPSDHTLHAVTAQLIDAQSGAPLGGLTVRAFDLDDGQRDLGTDRTSGRGLFTIGLLLPRDAAPAGRRLRVTVRAGAAEVATKDVLLSAALDQTIEVRVTPPAPEPAAAPRLEELQQQAALHIPPSLMQFLGRRGVYSLHDVRAAGGIGHLQGMPLAADHDAVRAIESHANLGVLTGSAPVSAVLIQAGYGSMRAIADTASAQFVAAMRNQVGDFDAAQIHAKARAQTDFLNNVLGWVYGDQAGGMDNPLTAIHALAPAACACRDGESATSHAAYLTEIINLAAHHLTDGGKPIGLAELAERLHQPLGEMAAGGERVTEPVRQVRLVIETLRSYLGSKSELEGEETYRLAAYRALLDGLGTSHDELRRARTAEPPRRQALADRLGLDEVGRLDKLFFDLERPRGLTEKALEELFGLVDTARAPFTAPSEPPSVAKWQAARRRARWKTQDRPQLPTHGRPLIDPDLITADDLRHPSPGQPPFIMLQARRNWVDSTIDKLKSLHRSAGLKATLEDVLPTPLPNLTTLAAALDAGEPDALATVRDRLDLTPDGLRHIVALQAKGERDEAVTAEEAADLFAILAQVKKTRQFADWIDEEHGTIVLGAGQFLTAARTQPLARWLGSVDARAAWESALAMRSTPPLVDPDLLGPGDFVSTDSAAFTLWSERRDLAARQASGWRTQTNNQAGKLDSLVAGVLGGSVAEIAELVQRWRAGDDVRARLEQLTIEKAAFARLCRLRELIGRDPANVIDSEWDEVYDILLSVWKRRQFADWRDEEETQAIVLAPDQFRLHDDPAFPISAWRGTHAARRQWQETLEGRIAEEGSAERARTAAVAAAEETALPLLRDAFVAAAGPEAKDFEEKARVLGRELHVDVRQAGAVKVTRVQHAIESLQQLLSLARAGQLESLQIDPGDLLFEEEWSWMQSYDTWRAALVAFLYPENFAAPSLRRPERQTPAFRALAAEVMAARPTAERAIQLADTYADYFRDVCSLTVEASCVAPTRLHKHDARHRTEAATDQPVLYLFARSKNNALYFSGCNPKDPTGYGQAFWERVPGLDRAAKILGATPYLPSEEHHFVLLFAQIAGDGAPRLVYTTYDLREERWTGEVIDLALPADGVFSAVVEQRDGYNRPPRLCISMRGGAGARHGNVPLEGYGLVYTRRLNRAANGWQSRDFRLLVADETTDAVFALLALDGASHQLVVYGSAANLRIGTFAEAGEADMEKVSSLGAGQWLGAMALAGEAFAFVRNGANAVVYGAIPVEKIGEGGITIATPGAPGLTHLTVHSGRDASAPGRHLAYQSRGGAYQARFVLVDGGLAESEAQLAAPRIDGPFDVPAALPESDLQLRALQIQTAFSDVARGPLSNLVYLEEAYYFLPMTMALGLQAERQYGPALGWYRTIYDYGAQEKRRNIYSGLSLGAALLERAADWLLDPLNPHSLAETRGSAYLRFTLLSLVRCLLDSADAEYARDTADSLPRARRQYQIALELLSQKELNVTLDRCARVIVDLDTAVAVEWRPVWSDVRRDLALITDVGALTELAGEIKGVFKGSDPWETRLERARGLVKRAREDQPAAATFAELLGRRGAAMARADNALLAQAEVAEAARRLGDAAGADFLVGVSAVSGVSEKRLLEERVDLPWLSGRGGSPSKAAGGVIAVNGIRKLTKKYAPAPSPLFPTAPNPLLVSLRRRAELNLTKLRQGRTIAGDRRALETHRYADLAVRAVELGRLAEQLAAARASADERRSKGEYALIHARQDLGLVEGVARMQAHRATQVGAEIDVAARQAHHARLLAESLERQLEEGTRGLERASLTLAAAVAPSLDGGDAALPSYEERAARWDAERASALRDLELAHGELAIARDHVRVLDDEQRIVELEAAYSQTIAEFLGHKFADPELYDWSRGVLDRAYRFCLGHATHKAQLALRQVAFERQETVPPLVQNDYVRAERLLDDMAQLSAYRATRPGRLELVKSISVARLAPDALVRFYDTGTLAFTTPLEIFDAEYPGHYQRLVRRVRVTAVASAPIGAVRATLSCARGSRAVVEGPWRRVTLLRGPDEVALSAAASPAGEVALAAQGGALAPFEGIGVETTWELHLPRAANRFNFHAIGDFILTVEYTALASAEYRQQVIQTLRNEHHANRPFSLRAQFAESWYDLHNPDHAASPMRVTFETRREDFPPNLGGLAIEDVALRLVPSNGERVELTGVQLRFQPEGAGSALGGAASSIDGVISTRQGSGGGWSGLRGLPPVGQWQLTLPEAARARFRADQIADVLLVVTYGGRTPAW